MASELRKLIDVMRARQMPEVDLTDSSPEEWGIDLREPRMLPEMDLRPDVDLEGEPRVRSERQAIEARMPKPMAPEPDAPAALDLSRPPASASAARLAARPTYDQVKPGEQFWGPGPDAAARMAAKPGAEPIMPSLADAMAAAKARSRDNAPPPSGDTRIASRGSAPSPSRAEWQEGLRGALQASREALGQEPEVQVSVGAPALLKRVPQDAPQVAQDGPGRPPLPVRELDKMVTGAGLGAKPAAPQKPGEVTSLRETLSRPSPLDELLEAQRADNVNRGLGRVSDALHSAFSGSPLQFRDRGGSAAGELLQRRQAGDAERARGEKEFEADPASETSRSTQELIRMALPDVAKELGPALDKLSHAKAMQVFPFLKDIAGKRAAQAQQKANASAKLEAEKDRRAWQGGENDKDRQARLRAAAMAAQRRQQTDDAKAKAGLSKTETDLRKEFSSLPAVKDFQQVSAGFDKVRSAAADASGAGDLALIYGFMKIVDPGSAVKEGEFALAANAMGLPDRMVAALQRVDNGERLSPDARADFVAQAKTLYGAQKRQFDQLAQQYRGLAGKAGVSPDAIVQDLAVADDLPIIHSGDAPGTVTVTRKSDGKSKQVAPEVAEKYRQDPNYEVR